MALARSRRDAVRSLRDVLGQAHLSHGVVKALKALSAIPRGRGARMPGRRSRERVSIFWLITYSDRVTISRKFEARLAQVAVPLMYQTDILEVAGLLVDLESEMQDG